MFTDAPGRLVPVYAQRTLRRSPAQSLIPADLGGVVTMSFFQCMAAFFNPVHRRKEGVLWGAASYTVVIFSLVTALAAITLDILSISYIDNREFPGEGTSVPLGPFGHKLVMDPKALTVTPGVIFFWNNLLADSFLVRRLFDPTSTHPGR